MVPPTPPKPPAGGPMVIPLGCWKPLGIPGADGVLVGLIGRLNDEEDAMVYACLLRIFNGNGFIVFSWVTAGFNTDPRNYIKQF